MKTLTSPLSHTLVSIGFGGSHYDRGGLGLKSVMTSSIASTTGHAAHVGASPS